MATDAAAAPSAAALLCLLLLALALTPAAAQDASGIDLSVIPASCLAPAATFQTECAAAIEGAQSALGLTSSGAPGNATAEQAEAAIARYAQEAPPPSAECCLASCQFNNQGCVCSPGVVQVAASFLGGGGGGSGDASANSSNTTAGSAVLLSVARAFHQACNTRALSTYPLYAGASGCAVAPAPGSPQAEAAVATCGGAGGGTGAAPAPPAAPAGGAGSGPALEPTAAVPAAPTTAAAAPTAAATPSPAAAAPSA